VVGQDGIGRMAASLDRGIARLRQDLVPLAGNAGTLQQTSQRLSSVSQAVDATAGQASQQASPACRRRPGAPPDTAADTRAAADELAGMSTRLQALVSRFRY
jgi:methyl-accepting chemotaxis protein